MQFDKEQNTPKTEYTYRIGAIHFRQQKTKMSLGQIEAAFDETKSVYTYQSTTLSRIRLSTSFYMKFALQSFSRQWYTWSDVNKLFWSNLLFDSGRLRQYNFAHNHHWLFHFKELIQCMLTTTISHLSLLRGDLCCTISMKFFHTWTRE